MYTPAAVPNDAPSGLKAFIADQLRQIANEFLSLQPKTIQLQILGAEPARLRNGMIVYADGTEWDPGSGEGFYGYENGAWEKL